MDIALNKESACRVLRSIRAGNTINVTQLGRMDLPVPNPGEGRTRWSKKLLRTTLPNIVHQPPGHRIHVASPTNRDRLCVTDVCNTIYENGLPQGAFMGIGSGVSISSPEMLFLEMGTVMSPVIQALLGFELCGTYSRDPLNPRDGVITHFIPAASSVESIDAFLQKASNIRGLDQARLALKWVRNNAWSAREAIVGLLMVMPVSELGYGFENIVLNNRCDTSILVGPNGSRVPDITIGDTGVHLNYDGEVHLDDRERYVDDRRRDRELAASGETVLVVTKEDLNENGGLDQVMLLAVEAIEHRGFGRMETVRSAIFDRELVARRQKLIWSLLTGRRGRELSLELAKES